VRLLSASFAFACFFFFPPPMGLPFPIFYYLLTGSRDENRNLLPAVCPEEKPLLQFHFCLCSPLVSFLGTWTCIPRHPRLCFSSSFFSRVFLPFLQLYKFLRWWRLKVSRQHARRSLEKVLRCPPLSSLLL